MERQQAVPPFTDDEKRWVLAEALKTSSVPLDRLLSVIREQNISPAWNYMLLPHGRNLKSCRDEFDVLRSGQQPQYNPVHFQPPSIATSSTSSAKRKSAPEIFETITTGPPAKRRISGIEIPSTTTRTLQPRPPNGSPLAMTPAPQPEPKKRGRPSKEAIAQRQLDAIARGEVIPPGNLRLHGSEQIEGGSISGYAMIAPSPTIPKGPMYSPGPGTPILDSGAEPGMGGRSEPSMLETPSTASRRKRAPRARAPRAQPGESQFSILAPITQPEPAQPQTIAEVLSPMMMGTTQASDLPQQQHISVTTTTTTTTASEAQPIQKPEQHARPDILNPET